MHFKCRFEPTTEQSEIFRKNKLKIIIMENYTITEQGENFYINGTMIPNEIFEQEKIDFKIVNRESFIDDLINWISESKTSDKELMKSDLKDLIKIDDEFILSSIDTNYYLYGNSGSFDNKCEEILNLIK